MIAQRFAATVLIRAIFFMPAWAVGQDVQKAPDVPTADLGISPEFVDDRGILRQDFGPTIAASSLIDRTLVDRFNQPVGEVIDLIVDPRTAELPLVLVDAIVRSVTSEPERELGNKPAEEAANQKRQAIGKQASDRRRHLLFPTASIFLQNEFLQNEFLQNEFRKNELLQADKQVRLKLIGDRSDAVLLKSAGPAQPLTRDWLVQRYLERKKLESWQKAVHIRPRNDPSGQPIHIGNYRLLRFTELRGATINDADEQALGQIADLAITIKGRRIPYAAITLVADAPDQLIQVPLLAFVVTADKAWKIEMPAKLVKESLRIDPKHWPTSISRGWHASIDARYNLELRDGVEVRGPDVLPAKTPGLAK